MIKIIQKSFEIYGEWGIKLKNKLKREVLLIILLSLVVTVILNLSIQYISDRFFDDEVDDYIMRVIEKGESIDRELLNKWMTLSSTEV